MTNCKKARGAETDRVVALRILPPTDTERKRRIQEAVAKVAGVSHPNLARLFEVGEAGEQAFVVTELVEGEPLIRFSSESDCTAMTCSASPARSPAPSRPPMPPA